MNLKDLSAKVMGLLKSQESTDKQLAEAKGVIKELSAKLAETDALWAKAQAGFDSGFVFECLNPTITPARFSHPGTIFAKFNICCFELFLHLARSFKYPFCTCIFNVLCFQCEMLFDRIFESFGWIYHHVNHRPFHTI